MHSSFYTRATEGRSSSDPEYVSSSEQSCDTVIFVGKGRQTNGNRKPTGGNTPATRAILNISDDQKKLLESSVSVQSSSDSIMKSFETRNETVDQSELGSQASLKKDSEVLSDSTCSDLSQQGAFEFEACKGVATQLGASQKNVDVRHDPLGDEGHQNFEESAISNNQTSDKLASCISGGSEQVRCRVRKRHHPLPSSLVKQNELWVDGPNAVAAVQASREDIYASDGVKEVLLDSIKPVLVNSVRLAKKLVLLSKEEKAGRVKDAAVGCATEATVVGNCSLEASTKLATGLVTCSGGMTARRGDEVKRRSSEETKKQVEEEGKQEGELLSQSVTMALHAKVAALSEEAGKRSKGIQQPSEILTSAANSGLLSESPPASRRTDSVNLGCQEESASVLNKKHLLRALSKLSAAEAHSAENSHHSSPRESVVHSMSEQPMLDADSCDRTAQWVKNIQEASASKFVQLLHSRKELLRSFRVRRNSHSMSKAPTMDFIQSCQILATFDQPAPVDIEHLTCPYDSTSNSGGESPGAKSVLDINENEARRQEINHEDCHSGIKSVKTTYSSCLQRRNECVSSKVGNDCGREKSNRSTSDKRALTECLRGSLLFCGRSSTARDIDETLYHVEETSKDVGRFDSSCVARLSQPDGASNPNIMDELQEHFSRKEPHMLQSRNNLQPSPLDQRKISGNPLLQKEKVGQAFHLDSTDGNTQEHCSFSTFHSSKSFIDSKATFPFNLNTRQRSESVSCNMTANASSFVLSSPTLSQHNSTIHVKSNSLQLTTCDDAENLCAAKSSSDEVVACSPATVSACSCHFDTKTNSGHQTNKISDKKMSLPCCCEVPTGFAVSETESHPGVRQEGCMERQGSDDSTFTLHLFRSLEGHDQLSGLDFGRITEIPNQGKH